MGGKKEKERGLMFPGREKEEKGGRKRKKNKADEAVEHFLQFF